MAGCPTSILPRRYAASVSAIENFAADAERDLDGFAWYAFVFVNGEVVVERDKLRLEALPGRPVRSGRS